MRLELSVHVGEALIFHGNLVHGGANTRFTNPRIFATYGPNNVSMEPRNYITECVSCDGIDCSVCLQIEQLKERGLYYETEYENMMEYDTNFLIDPWVEEGILRHEPFL